MTDQQKALIKIRLEELAHELGINIRNPREVWQYAMELHMVLLAEEVIPEAFTLEHFRASIVAGMRRANAR